MKKASLQLMQGLFSEIIKKNEALSMINKERLVSSFLEMVRISSESGK